MSDTAKSLAAKERIINAATTIIKQSNGNISEITTRNIAERARVGNGLINYHFNTKENLVAICVQRIVEQIIDDFDTVDKRGKSNESPKQQMINSAARVFEFLFANPAISRISILADFAQPAIDSNTIKSQNSIQYALGDSMGKRKKKLFSFALVAAMQAAFLSHEIGKEITGHKLDSKKARKEFVTRLVDMLFLGVEGQ